MGAWKGARLFGFRFSLFLVVASLLVGSLGWFYKLERRLYGPWVGRVIAMLGKDPSPWLEIKCPNLSGFKDRKWSKHQLIILAD
jgi:hypothetical protein